MIKGSCDLSFLFHEVTKTTVGGDFSACRFGDVVGRDDLNINHDLSLIVLNAHSIISKI